MSVSYILSIVVVFACLVWCCSPHPPNNILHEMSNYKMACCSSIRSGVLNSQESCSSEALGPELFYHWVPAFCKLLTYANWKLNFSIRCDFKNVSLWSNQRAKWGESESGQGSLFSFAKDTMVYTLIKHSLLPILGMAQCMHWVSILVSGVIRFKYTTWQAL